MNYNQNEKLNQVSETTLIIGVDIASVTNYARAFDWRRREVGKLCRFTNTLEGFQAFVSWASDIKTRNKLDKIIVAAEPTGHYWFGLADYLKDQEIKLVLVNPYHVKQCKELDDNLPSKTDAKDPKTIANLAIDGRYMEPYIPEGVYASIRIVYNCKINEDKRLVSLENRIKRWLKIWFPEFLDVFGKLNGIGSLTVLKVAPLPQEIIALGADGINNLWRAKKLRALGLKRATSLYEAAISSIGRKEGAEGARYEFDLLMEDYEHSLNRRAEIIDKLSMLLKEIPNADKLLKIKGIGVVSVAGFFAEVGDLGRFKSPKQIQKLAGLALRENSSGTHKGMTTISKRGRHRLRAILFQAAISLVGLNAVYNDMHKYYTTRTANPLKKKQSIVAISCKLLRVIYAVALKGKDYDEKQMLQDIHRPELTA